MGSLRSQGPVNFTVVGKSDVRYRIRTDASGSKTGSVDERKL